MSPASKSKSKSKNKPSAGSVKEQQKPSSKLFGSINNGGGSSTSAYNPVSGTFHALEPSSFASSPPFHDNARFLNIDDTDEHSSSPHGTISEYDSVSNNGSCSGESEDPKEKIAHSTPRQEAMPGSDNERREKIRLTNERKHQRQRERRAQELHDRCSGYLMSRKLEELSQKLVRMGFPSEQAILALMLNEGKVEESVAYLLDGNEEAQRKDVTNLGSGANLKIDISKDLARILALEVRYKCSKQEVERAVVACEGDLEKAEDTLRAQKQEQSATPLKPEETVETKNLIRPKEMPAASVTIQQRRNERDFNYPKETAAVPTFPEPGNRNLHFLKTNQLKALAEKRGAGTGSGPSASLNLAPPMEVVPPSAKVEARVGVVGNERRILQQGGLGGSVVVMQRPQSINAKQDPISSVGASPSGAVQWYTSSVRAVENIRSNGKFIQNQSRGSLGRENQISEQFHHQAPYKEFPFTIAPVDATSAGLGGYWSTSGASSPSPMFPSDPRGSWSTMGASPHSLTVPSSLGLFSGQGSSGTFGSASHVDWNTGGLMPELDYTNIDWTLNYPSPSKSSGLLLGLSSLLRNSSGMRLGSANGKFMSGLQDGVATEPSSSAGSRDWTSPFAGKDIFSVPRQFVTFPSP